MRKLTEEQQRFLDTGKYLTKRPDLSRKYSKIAGTEVEVYIDRAHGFPVVYYKGKRSMELVTGDNSSEQNRVMKHFRRVRGGTQDYKEVWAKLDEKNRDDERQFQDAKNDLIEQQAAMHAHYEFDYGPRSVVVNGRKK